MNKERVGQFIEDYLDFMFIFMLLMAGLLMITKITFDGMRLMGLI